MSGMLCGISLMLIYILKFKFGFFGGGTSDDWWFGVSPEGFGTLSMIVNLIVTITISSFTKKPSEKIQKLVIEIRKP